MLTIHGETPDELFTVALEAILDGGYQKNSRNGPVLKMPTPVCIYNSRPDRRILFNEARDHNIFFAFFEALWMLEGRDDLGFLSYFNSNMKSYSDDGVTVRGSAYGKRWRSWFGYDQIKHVLKILKDDPDSRRCVLTMWDAASDPLVESKDIPCNTQIFLDVDNRHEDPVLNLTVVNRSNDLIYGALGSNIFHFTFLQEYLAGMLGMGIGSCYQITNNLHLYTEFEVTKRVIEKGRRNYFSPYDEGIDCFPLFTDKVDPELWDEDLRNFFRRMHGGLITGFRHEFFMAVAEPLFLAWQAWKEKGNPDRCDNALAILEHMPSCDYARAAEEWIVRRKKRLEKNDEDNAQMARNLDGGESAEVSSEGRADYSELS